MHRLVCSQGAPPSFKSKEKFCIPTLVHTGLHAIGCQTIMGVHSFESTLTVCLIHWLGTLWNSQLLCLQYFQAKLHVIVSLLYQLSKAPTISHCPVCLVVWTKLDANKRKGMKRDANGRKWLKMDENIRKRTKMDKQTKNEHKVMKMNKYGQKLLCFVSGYWRLIVMLNIIHLHVFF